MDEPVLTIDQVSKQFGHFQALDQVSFQRSNVVIFMA